MNNPTAVAVHEARQLWPQENFQCVVSLGTGRCQPIEVGKKAAANWGDKIRTVINSATDTEGQCRHTRINPNMPYYDKNNNESEILGFGTIIITLDQCLRIPKILAKYSIFGNESVD